MSIRRSFLRTSHGLITKIIILGIACARCEIKGEPTALSILLRCLDQWSVAHTTSRGQCGERCRSSGDEYAEDSLPNRILFHNRQFLFYMNYHELIH